MDIGFPFPQIEFHVQFFIVLLEIRHRYADNMFPKRPVTPHAVLQLISGFHCLFLIGTVLLGSCAGSGINLFQFRNGKRRFLRIISGKTIVKIHQIRLSFLQFRNNQPHLQPPVAQMNIADHLMPRISPDPFYAFTDDCRTQMPYMQRLRHIRSAIIDQYFLRLFGSFQPKLRIFYHSVQIVRQKSGT